MLEVNGLTRTYGSFKAVDNVSFSIGKGEIVGLLGHNGAGKTTILRMISGFLEPDEGGEIRIDGVSIAEDPKSIQLRLGYLPEALPLYPDMIVADYLDYAAELKGLNSDDKKREIRNVVHATDISPKLLAPVSTLSRGYKQRVSVAQAILGRPRLLILDEPTNGLDPGQTQEMRELIRSIAQDATVILSTHIMQEVEALCSRVLILRAGTLTVDARLGELKQSNRLILESTLPGKEMEKIRSIDGVGQITQLQPSPGVPGSQLYRITLETLSNGREVSAAIATEVVGLGYKVYRLLPEQRDLETLFREVNGDGMDFGRMDHAA